MQSDDPRVRAHAIEGLWYWRTAEATELFEAAASDVNHRVVGSALVGLYMQDDPCAFAKMIELSESAAPSMRAAMAWCLGFIKDERAIPSLYRLAKDASAMVRKRALRSLLALQPNDTATEIIPTEL
jgi:HEAT repeat protein